MRKDLIVSTLTTLTVVLLSTAPLPAIDLDLAPEAALCPVSPTEGALAMAPCRGTCTVLEFSPQSGVVCTWDGTCTGGGPNRCCNYNCACGDSTGLPGPPTNACEFTAPTDCCNCPVTTFGRNLGIVCTATGTCGEDNCCEYTCTCGVTSGLPSQPANTCALDLPCGCCVGPGCGGICPIGYCNGPGERCVAIGCGGGCCIFGCGFSDPTCTGFDPIPPEACSFP